MEAIIDGYNFAELEVEKYWSLPKNKNAKIEIKNAVFSDKYIAAEKIDGHFYMLIKDMKGNYIFRGRSRNVNKEFINKVDFIPHIIKELKNIPNGTVLLGEAYLPKYPGSRNVTTIMGCLLEKSLKRQENEDKKIHFYTFDCLAYSGHNIINEPFERRIDFYLNYELLDCLEGKYVHLANYYEGQELWDYIGSVLAAGGEGVVLQSKDAPYEPNKRKAWKTIKVKKEIANTIDCFLTGNYKISTKEYQSRQNLEEWLYWQHLRTGEKMKGYFYDDFQSGATIEPISKGWYYNYAGSIELGLYDKANNKIVPCGWISNITEDVRKGIIENPDNWKYKVVEINAMSIEEDTKHFRHGKIVNWRDSSDKNWKDCDLSQLYNG